MKDPGHILSLMERRFEHA